MSRTEDLCTELLRQAAQQAGLLAAEDPPVEDGVVSEAAVQAIEALLDRELRVPEPAEEDCRRFYEASPARWQQGERVHARHILLAVTDGVDVQALRQRAEKLLLDLRCATSDDAFGEAARQWSNCPSGAEGGELGWLAAHECAPEFARELFGHAEVGVLPRVVHSRFGLHVVEVMAREAGTLPPFDQVRSAVSSALQRQASRTALRQYLQVLAAQAGVTLDELPAVDSPLVQ